MSKLRKLWLWGLFYGFVLFVFAFLETGGGHGSCLMFGWFSSPLSLVPGGVLGILLLWPIIGLLLMHANRPNAKATFLIIMALHYISIPLIARSEAYADPVYLKKSWAAAPEAFYLGFGIYLIGQIWIWTVFVRKQFAKS